jgi:hypothetical protein
MTGDGARDGSNPKAFDAEDGDSGQGDLLGLEQEMSPLLDTVGAFAREEEAEIGTYAANTSHILSDVARESAVQKILALQARERTERSADDDSGVARPVAAIALVQDRPRRSRLKSGLLAVAGGCGAVAVALVLWLHPAPGELALPAYSIAARGGIKQARGVAADGAEDGKRVVEEQQLEPDSLLVVTARPETAVDGTVAARVFVVQGDQATEVAPNAQVAPTGAIELRFRGADLIGARHGAASLRVIVGRPEALQALPAGPGLPASAVTDARWRVLTVPLALPQS